MPDNPYGLKAQPSTWSWLLDMVTRPGAMVAGGIDAAQHDKPMWPAVKAAAFGEEKKNFDDVLANAGYKPGLGRSAAGFGLDLVVDPTNLIPGKWLGKGVEYGAKGLGKATDLAAKIPHVGPAIDEILNSVKPYRELRHTPEKFQDAAKLYDLEVKASRAAASENARSRFTPLLKKLDDLDAGSRSAYHAAENTIPTQDSAVRAVADELLTFGKERAAKEVAAKVLKPENVSHATPYVPRGIKGDDLAGSAMERLKASRIGNPQFTKKRVYETALDMEKVGVHTPDYNPIANVARREASGEKAIITKRFFDDVATNPEMASMRAPAAAAPKGFRALENIPEPFAESIKGLHFAPDAAQHLEKMFKISGEPSTWKRVGEIYDKLLNVWKGTATVGRPAFHLRNAPSNIYMAMLGDMKLGDVANRFGTALAAKAGYIPEKIAGYSGEEAIAAAKRFGAIGTEFGVAGDTGASAEKAFRAAGKSTGEKALDAAKNPLGTWIEGGQKVGGFIEDTGRLALFIDQLEKGASFQKAALHVNKHMIDYSTMTPIERQVKRLVPFYVWQNRILPILVEGTIKHPSVVSAQGKFKNAVEDLVNEKDYVPEEERPAYVQQGEMVQAPGDKRQFMNPGLPGADLNIIPAGGITPEYMRSILSRTNPLLKMVVEGAGTNLLTGKPMFPQGISAREPASGTLTMIDKVLPSYLAKAASLGRDGAQTTAPAWANWVTSNINPIGEAVGKGMRLTPAGESAAGEGPFGINRAWWNFAAAPSFSQDPIEAFVRRFNDAKPVANRDALQEALRQLQLESRGR